MHSADEARARGATQARRFLDRESVVAVEVEASFEVLFLHGWAPHPSQPKPLRPGSAAHRLAAALETTEFNAGEKAERR